MCYKAVNNCVHALEFVPDCYEPQKMCKKAVDTYTSAVNLFLIDVRLKKCLVKLFLKNAFS